jgi:hypothetical protein
VRWPGYPRYRDASALLSIVYTVVLFAKQAMGLRAQPQHPKLAELLWLRRAKDLELVLGGGLLGAEGHDLVGAHHADHNQIPARGFTTFLTFGTPPQ